MNESRHQVQEPLRERVNRAKARWLSRVMYGSSANSTQKCFAYAVTDHLNCVTLDCWPALPKLAKRLGFRSAKTLRRAASGLEGKGLLAVRVVDNLHRFAPVFLPTDEASLVHESGQTCPRSPDNTVRESFLSILIESSARGSADGFKGSTAPQPSRWWKQRGSIEIQVARWLGPDGIEVLGRLAQIDDGIVDRLCRAQVAGALTDKEHAAARLAAEQVRR